MTESNTRSTSLSVKKLPSYTEYLEGFTEALNQPFIPSEQSTNEIFYIRTGTQVSNIMILSAAIIEKSSDFDIIDDKLYLIKQENNRGKHIVIEPFSFIRLSELSLIGYEQVQESIGINLTNFLAKYLVDTLELSERYFQHLQVALTEDSTGVFAYVQNLEPIPRRYSKLLVKLIAKKIAFPDWNYKRNMQAVNEEMVPTKDGQFFRFKMPIQLSVKI